MDICNKKKDLLFKKGEALLEHYESICLAHNFGILFIENMGENGYGSTRTRKLEEEMKYVCSYEISKNHIAVIPT